MYRKNLSAIIYRYRFKKLKFIGIAQGFFEVIDYRAHHWRQCTLDCYDIIEQSACLTQASKFYVALIAGQCDL